MNIKQLMDAFATKSREVDGLINKGNDLTHDDFLKVKELNAEIEALQGQITAAESQEKELGQMRDMSQKRLAELNKVHNPLGNGAQVLHSKESGAAVVTPEGMVFDGPKGMSKKQLEAISTQDYAECFVKYLSAGIHGVNSMTLKTLQEGIDTAGGFLVPEQILRKLLQREATPTRVAGKVSRLTTGRDHLTIPRTIYTADDLYSTGIRAFFPGEIPATSTVHRTTTSPSADPVFGQQRIAINTVMLSSMITQDIIEDSMFGLTEYLGAKYRETIDLLYDDKILNGTGVGQPEGILLAPISGIGDAPQYIVSGSAATVTANGLLSLAWSVPEQYEQNLEWVMNKTNTAQAIAKLVDGESRYIWSMGVQDGGLRNPLQRSLVGYPVTFSGFMPNLGAGAFPIILGDLKGYSLIERVGLSIQVLNETYAELNQKVILGRLRFGGAVTEPWRIKVQKCST